MKTHGKTTITGSLKNQFGCLSKARHEYHLVIDEVIADINRIIRPALSLMDGTIGLEGNGPKAGRPRIADRILCSSDPVALDTVQSLSMGIPPEEVGHLRTASERGIGTCRQEEIEIRGLDPQTEPVPFARARENLVGGVETALRRSWARKAVFDSPLFSLCLLGAKSYYHVWTALHSQRSWSAALEHPIYGEQWKYARLKRAR